MAGKKRAITEDERVAAGTFLMERCPRRRHRVKPELRPALMAWLLSMETKYEHALRHFSNKQLRRIVPGHAETVQYLQWAVKIVRELVGRVGEQVDSLVWWERMAFVADAAGLDAGALAADQAAWESPSLPGMDD